MTKQLEAAVSRYVHPSGLEGSFDGERQIIPLTKRLDRPCQPVILVDQASAFHPVGDTVDDLVHPNEQGAAKIAQRWYAALNAEIGKPRTTCSQ